MPNNKNRIQTYVNDAAYERLQAIADSRRVSLSSVVAEILQTVEQDASPSATSDSPCVTRKEMVEYVNEVLMRAEAHWEASSGSQMALFKSALEFVGKERDQLKASQK